MSPLLSFSVIAAVVGVTFVLRCFRWLIRYRLYAASGGPSVVRDRRRVGMCRPNHCSVAAVRGDPRTACQVLALDSGAGRGVAREVLPCERCERRLRCLMSQRIMELDPNPFGACRQVGGRPLVNVVAIRSGSAEPAGERPRVRPVRLRAREVGAQRRS